MDDRVCGAGQALGIEHVGLDDHRARGPLLAERRAELLAARDAVVEQGEVGPAGRKAPRDCAPEHAEGAGDGDGASGQVEHAGS